MPSHDPTIRYVPADTGTPDGLWRCVAEALMFGPVELSVDLSGYGEGGWHDAHTGVDVDDFSRIIADAMVRADLATTPDEARAAASAAIAAAKDSDTRHHQLQLLRYVLEGRYAHRGVWSVETAMPGRHRNVAAGQQLPTAVVVASRFGGQLLRGGSPDSPLWGNLLPDGTVVDLTADADPAVALTATDATSDPAAALADLPGLAARVDLILARLAAR